MATFELIKKQAVKIAKHEHRDREASEPANAKPVLISSGDFVRDFVVPERKQPLRSWAELVAQQITEPQWQEMVWHAEETVRPFRGSVVSFFETAFEGLRLKDGATIWA